MYPMRRHPRVACIHSRPGLLLVHLPRGLSRSLSCGRCNREHLTSWNDSVVSPHRAWTARSAPAPRASPEDRWGLAEERTAVGAVPAAARGLASLSRHSVEKTHV